MTAPRAHAYGAPVALDIVPWTLDRLELGRAVIREPELAPQFEQKLGLGDLERWLADPFCHAALRWLAMDGDTPAAVAFGFLLPGIQRPWAMLRIGVREEYRRRGLGHLLLDHQMRALAEAAPECGDVCLAAWEPHPEAEAFAAALGFTFARRFWEMERPANDLPHPAWPPGIVPRVFDGSDVALADYNDVYNASFASHYRFVPSTVDTLRARCETPGFIPGSVMLAYVGDRVAGFCRNFVTSSAGEIATLGVAPAFQGRGLGRALLRWGVRWLGEREATPITLLVDGENESALRLYRSDGFVVERTRTLWSRPFSVACA